MSNCAHPMFLEVGFESGAQIIQIFSCLHSVQVTLEVIFHFLHSVQLFVRLGQLVKQLFAPITLASCLECSIKLGLIGHDSAPLISLIFCSSAVNHPQMTQNGLQKCFDVSFSQSNRHLDSQPTRETSPVACAPSVQCSTSVSAVCNFFNVTAQSVTSLEMSMNQLPKAD